MPPFVFAIPKRVGQRRPQHHRKRRDETTKKKREIDAMEHLRDVMEDHHPKVERHPPPNGR